MEKETGKKKVLCIFALLFISLFLIGIVSAADVGYILKSKSKVDKNVISVFKEMGLTYELILDSKIKNYDLSKYRFLFVDNVRLTNARKIPIYNYPSVIMNGYHGAEWGLTDNDGLSQLSADQPLNVRLVNDGLEQVYTKAEANGKQLFYYYLSEKNCELNNWIAFAKTWTGNLEFNQIGDVISVAPKGTVLMNGKTNQGDLCFYGIINTKYWTPEARELFKKCVDYVNIECSTDDDCSADEESEPYCKDGNAYKDITDFYCDNPGTSSSECNSNVISELVKECEYGCENGECLPECTLDSQCDADYYSENYCEGKNVYKDLHDFSCENEECKEETTKELVEECEYLCENGQCKDVVCSNDSQCNDDNIYTYDECNNPGTSDSYCSHTPVNCVTNNDCGTTGFIGTEFCSLNDVYKLFQSSTCINPGLKTSHCDVMIEQTLVNDCGDSSCSDYSESYCKDGDVYQSRTCNEKGCYLGACFSVNNQEENLVEECEFGCENGVCLDNKKHDVALIDFDNSVGGIKIQDSYGNNVDYTLICNQKYKIWIDVKNKGNYSENITFNGNIDGLLFNHNPANNLAVGDDSLKYKLVNITLTSGVYNIIVNAIINNDNNPLDNQAKREIKVVCESKCTDNDDCDDNQFCELGSCGSNQGSCIEKPEICNDVYQPVCGCDGKTYANDCSRMAAGITKNHDGECYECVNGDTKKCGTTDIGECEYGLQTCSNGKWGECVGNIEPSKETCDLKDNDCDGVVDENNGDCEQGEVCDNGECKKIKCSFNDECGTDGYVGDLFCENNGVYQNYQTFKCNKPGTFESYCTNSIEAELTEQCFDNQVCSNAKCQDIECKYDDDCDDFNYFTLDKCNNPGTVDSYCTNEPMNCKKNSDCGRDGWTGDLFCSSNNIFQNFITYKCNNPGTTSSYCSHNTNALLVEECESGQVCSNGQCKGIICNKNSDCDDNNLYTQDECNNPGTSDSYCSHDFVNCVTNNDCGPTGFVGWETCAENDVVKYFQNSTCINSGTMQSYCEISITPNFLKDCGENYCTDFGANYCKDNNIYHAKTCYEKGCYEGACFKGNPTTQEELVMQCQYGCNNGMCTGECSLNSDCGNESYSQNYCKNGNVVKDHLIPQCTNSLCYLTNQTQIVEVCAHGCSNGTCIGECSKDSDCGTEHYSDNYCLDKKVVRKHFIPKCTNSQCSIQEIIETIETCSVTCENGECVSGIHDVALVDFTNSVNKIKLETFNGTNIQEEIPTLNCGDTIKAKVKVLNKGDFSENVVLKGNVNGINFFFTDINGLMSGASTYRSSLFPYIKLNLPAGLYDLIVNAQIPVDNNPLDNIAKRQIRIVCQNACTKDCDCGTDGFIDGLFCKDGDVFKKFKMFKCNNPGTSDSYCSSSIIDKLIEDCFDKTCSNGQCVQQCTKTNSDVNFNSFNAPWNYGGECSQSPILIASNLKTGDIVKVESTSGNVCGREWPRTGKCISDTSGVDGDCLDEGLSYLFSCTDTTYVKIGFYDSNKNLILEKPLAEFMQGIATPTGATSVYVYFKEYNPHYYFDNNGAYYCNVKASVSSGICS